MEIVTNFDVTKLGLIMINTKNIYGIFKPVLRALALLSLLSIIACTSPAEKANKYLEDGMQLLKQGDFDKADLEFRNALQIVRSMTQALWGRALVAEKQGDWQRLFSLLNNVIEQDPMHLDAHVKLGRLLLAANQLDKALDISNKSLELDNNNIKVLALRAALLLKLEDANGAVEYANRVLVESPDNIDALVVLATERLAAGDSEKAVEYMDKGLETNQKHIALQLIKIQALDNLAELDMAEQIFRKLIEYYPETKAFTNALVQFYLKHDKKDEAEKELKYQVEQNPNDNQSKLTLIKFLNTVFGNKQGIVQLENYVKQQPKNFELKFALVNFYLVEGDSKQANTLLEQIISSAKESDVIKAKGILAGTLLSSGNKGTAKILINEILLLDSRNEQASILKASMNIDEQKVEDAVADLRTLLRDVPNSSRALLLLAKSYVLSGSPELADEYYFRALQASKMSPTYGIAYTRFLLSRKQSPRAVEILEGLLSKFPNNISALKLLAQAKLSSGDWVGAQQISDEIRMKDGDEGLSDQILGAIYAGKREYDESISIFKRAYESAPSRARPLAALVRTYILADKTEEANRFLTSVLAANPSNLNARILQGQMFALNGDKDSAISSFNKVINQNPTNAVGYYSLAMLHLRDKDIVSAEDVITIGLKKTPTNFMLRLIKAGILETHGKSEQAISLYEQLLIENPNADLVANNLASLLSETRIDQESTQRAYNLAQRFKRSDIPQFKDTFGWANYKVGKFTDAASLLESATEQLPGTTIFHYHLGMNYLAMNDKERARIELEKAMQSAGDSSVQLTEEIRKSLANL